jgi:hypothetical protein
VSLRVDDLFTFTAKECTAFIPSVLDDFGLDPYTFRIYCRICRRAGNGEAYEAIPNMARECLMSVRQVQVCLKRLEEMDLIDRETRSGRSNVYRIKSFVTHAPGAPMHQVPDTHACDAPGGAGDAPIRYSIEGHPNKDVLESTRFWKQLVQVYPDRDGWQNLPTAERLFQGLDPAERESALEGARRFRAFCDWKGKTGTEFVPMMSTWLEQRRWTEVFPAAEAPTVQEWVPAT